MVHTMTNRKSINRLVLLYRLLVIFIYTISLNAAYFYFFANDLYIDPMRALYTFKYFTCIAAFMNVLYFIMAIPLDYFTDKTIGACQYLVTFGFTGTAMLCYWGVVFYDPTYITEMEDLKNMPFWFNHMSHLLPAILLIIDAYLCHPKIVSLSSALKIECFIGIIYNLFVEIGILVWNTSPYPLFLRFNILVRFLNYASAWCITTGSMLVGQKYVQYLHDQSHQRIKQH
ncbi:unnamed protein product [Schistosoma turkestanicum]|nr:unnamed protein product [Schistosoma turkestanicum]